MVAIREDTIIFKPVLKINLLILLILFSRFLLFFRKNRILASLLLGVGKIFLSKQDQNVLAWKLTNGDKSLRINYPLNSNSVVFDVGGYLGDSSSDIYEKYKCYVYVFEPVQEYYKTIKKRFRNLKKIYVLNYGLAVRTQYINLHLAKDATSEYGKSTKLEKVKLEDVKKVLEKYKIKNVDLIELNIEGGEYELLEYLIYTNLIKKFKDIQVQFHNSIENAEERRNKIQNYLRKTHKLTYEYPFVWENWSLRNN